MEVNSHRVYTYRGIDGETVPKTIKELIVKEGVQELPEGLCRNCKRLRKVTLPNGLITIGAKAFRSCHKLVEIRICNTVQNIGYQAFMFCRRLTEIEFEFSASSPHQLQAIRRQAFHCCKALKRIKLPS